MQIIHADSVAAAFQASISAEMAEYLIRIGADLRSEPCVIHALTLAGFGTNTIRTLWDRAACMAQQAMGSA